MNLPTPIRERLERCTTLPSLPSVAIRILELCQQEQLDLSQISKVISNDPALSAKLMKTANSPIFALRREVTTISYAVSLLGISAIRTLVLSFSLAANCQTGNHRRLRDFWRRSMLSAMAAREICRVPYGGMQEEAFLGALLQDIGMLALAQALGMQYTKVLEAADGDHDKLVELEREAFGGDHAEVGAWLLTRWRVPAMLAQVVAASHSAWQTEEPGGTGLDHALKHIVALSGRFADQWTGVPAEAATKLAEAVKTCGGAGIAVDIDAVNAHLVQQAPTMAPLFNVQLDATGMAAVLEQAQEVLMALSLRASQELTDIHQALARLESRTATLLVEAQRDQLTAVANRGYTSSYLDEVFQAAIDSNKLVGVIFADVDHFKKVNDTHGHVAGDTVLQSVAQTMVRSVRGGDFVGRWGGEEFVVIMRADSANDLAAVAERIRANVAETAHSIAGRPMSVTISLGCALLEASRHRTSADLLEEADRALYQAKREGRNQFRLSKAA
jgi:diguanylate cyclase (GGDEF)-like protein